MKRIHLLSSVVFGLGASVLGVGCQDSFKNCENTATCPPPDGDGGGTSTGGGDGDGDGDTGGGDGDGDGDTGGTGTGGGEGDGDGDNTGGMGGDPNDPCLLCEADEYCTSEKACVGCLNDNHCGDASVCDPSTWTCVGCIEQTDCEDPALPMCDGNVCGAGCTGPADCARFVDTPVCDEGSGECVGCTPATEAADCGAKSCDPATFTCGPNDRESRGTCRSCVSDSDCVANHHCVPMEYPIGTDRAGGYCLELSGACDNPYTVIISSRESLSGVNGESYCGINENLASCEAVKALEDDLRCDADGAEGQCWPLSGTIADAVEVPGAVCRKFSGLGGDRCTYACAEVTECRPTGPAAICGPGLDPDPVAPNFCGGIDENP